MSQQFKRYRIDKRLGCWVWTGSKFSPGYGAICVPKLKGGYCVQQAAHKAFYTKHVAPIPRGYVVDHLCLNKSCVNPQHLEAVTHAENLRRSGMRHRGPISKKGNARIHVGICICCRCGHRWLPRGSFMPLRCGKCKSPYWRRSVRKQ